MLDTINRLECDTRPILNDGDIDMLYILLGRTVDRLNEEYSERLCLIVLEYVTEMYRKNVKLKSGIG